MLQAFWLRKTDHHHSRKVWHTHCPQAWHILCSVEEHTHCPLEWLPLCPVQGSTHGLVLLGLPASSQVSPICEITLVFFKFLLLFFFSRQATLSLVIYPSKVQEPVNQQKTLLVDNTVYQYAVNVWVTFHKDHSINRMRLNSHICPEHAHLTYLLIIKKSDEFKASSP